jgi:nickel/cobalt transporter (NicO) family protein
MVQLVIGSFLLSLVHALIPNHWIPLVTIGKAEKWSLKETLGASAIIAFCHALSTILLGIVIGFIGLKLATDFQHIATIIAPLVLLLMGLMYFGMDFKHSHHEHLPDEAKLHKKSRLTILFSLCVAMFFSPCLEVETYYFTAGVYGWKGILTVSFVYLIITVGGILSLVFLGSKSIEKFNWHFLEHYEKKITGSILILLGITSFFINY